MIFALTCATLAVLFATSIVADRRFRSMDRIPMQWSLRGKVNWTAPRRLGLAFTPVLAVPALGAVAATQGTAAVAAVALALVAAHLLHVYLIGRGKST